MSRVFDNGPGDRGSILCRDISKTQKMVVDASLLNTQDYKVRINVTLCRRSAKQTIPLSVLARNQTKGFGLEISGDRK